MFKNQHESQNQSYAISSPKSLDMELPYQLLGAGVHYLQYPIDRPFGFRHYQWIQTVRGEGQLILQGNEYRISGNYGLLIYPEETHSYKGKSHE